MKVAINGFGRIGRPTFKLALENPNIEVVAINDLNDIDGLAYLLKHDTVFGIYGKNVEVRNDKLIVDGNEVKVYCEKDPNNLPWGELGVDVVLECTGVFKDREKASQHIDAGAKKVIISAPTKDDSIKTIVVGCNDDEITDEDSILSMASCTTNCVAPMVKILDDAFGIENSLMTTIHSYTATQAVVDGPTRKKKDFRVGRAAAQNIIPTTTGAAIAATKTLPQLKGKFDGMAFRVPTPAGSASDLVAVVKKETTEDEVNKIFEDVARNEFKDILRVTDEPIVSSDIVGDSHSCIIDAPLTKVIGGNLVKVIGWYDNEWGYSCRLVDLAEKFGK